MNSIFFKFVLQLESLNNSNNYHIKKKTITLCWFRLTNIFILSTPHCLEQKVQTLMSRNSMLGPRKKYTVSDSYQPHKNKTNKQKIENYLLHILSLEFPLKVKLLSITGKGILAQ